VSPRLIPIDGNIAEGGGHILRTALALSVATGQGFEMTRIGAMRPRPGLRPSHLAAVRAAAMISDARVGGAFEGSPDLRFEPGAVAAGEFRFEIGASGAITPVLQMVVPCLATAARVSTVHMEGGTHVPGRAIFEYVSGHWLALLSHLGLHARATLSKAGFFPKGGGEIAAEVSPWTRPATLRLEGRGPLRELRGLSAAGRLKGDVAERQRDAAAAVLWEKRRLEVRWEIAALPAVSPGSFVMMEAVYETGRGAFAVLGERGIPVEGVGERAAQQVLRFLEGTGAVDGPAASQLLVPMAVARGGGVVTTSEMTKPLQTTVDVLALFGVAARTSGLVGGEGHVEVDAH
jgi:RNA 3'-terminal phosphate cyclase (ATP)